MKKTIIMCVLIALSYSWASARFAFQETEPYCSITGTTHTSFPWEISDTSSWSIPTAYQWICDETPVLSDTEKKRIHTVMMRFFEDKNLTWPVYGWVQSDAYGWENTLNPQGQKFVNEVFFPAIIKYITKERIQSNPNTKNIAILNEAVKNIGYDYFLYNN